MTLSNLDTRRPGGLLAQNRPPGPATPGKHCRALLARQQYALAEAGCLQIFADTLSGKAADRPELVARLDL